MYKLLIAVVGYDYIESCKAARLLAEKDISEIKSIKNKGTILMQDGTIYKCFSTPDFIAGHKIDQLIIVDDERFNVTEKQRETIKYIDCAMITSCVPNKYMIQVYG